MRSTWRCARRWPRISLTLPADDAVRCVVVTGDEKAFAAGADVADLAQRTPTDPAFERTRNAWAAIERYRRPIIAAVNGFALGGGCELALHCDIIIAGEGAKLGQPEVKLGIMPGAGGTQRLVRAAGKFAAMRWLLTGDLLSASEAHRIGLVSEVVADVEVLKHALGNRGAYRGPATPGGRRHQGRGAARRGPSARGRAAPRRQELSGSLHHRGPDRGYAGLPREAQA